jgi:hypothetical protein
MYFTSDWKVEEIQQEREKRICLKGGGVRLRYVYMYE